MTGFKPRKPETAFDEMDLTEWAVRYDTNIPDAPSKVECLTAPEVLSFQALGRKLGLIVTMKLNNGQTITVSLNPVIAKYLADAIESGGENHGWMNRDHHITFPIGDK